MSTADHTAHFTKAEHMEREEWISSILDFIKGELNPTDSC